jgi:hypothetical protein
VPRVPLTHPHGECVDVLVHLIQQGDGLDDHVVRSSRVKLDLFCKEYKINVGINWLCVYLRVSSISNI